MAAATDKATVAAAPAGAAAPSQETVVSWSFGSRIAILLDDIEPLQKCIDEGMDVNTVHVARLVPLVMFTALTGNAPALEALVAKGAKTKGGLASYRGVNWSFPQLCGLFGYKRLLDVFLSAPQGSDDIITGKAAIPPEFAARIPRWENALHCAAAGGHPALVQTAVSHCGIDPHSLDTRKRDALEAACAGLRAFSGDICDMCDMIISEPMVTAGGFELQLSALQPWPRGTGMGADEDAEDDGDGGDEEGGSYTPLRPDVRGVLDLLIYTYGVGCSEAAAAAAAAASAAAAPAAGAAAGSGAGGKDATASAAAAPAVTREQVAAAAARGAYQRYGLAAIQYGNREALQFLLEEGLLQVAPLAELGKMHKATAAAPAAAAGAATDAAGDAAAAAAAPAVVPIGLLDVVKALAAPSLLQGLRDASLRMAAVPARKHAFLQLSVPCAKLIQAAAGCWDDVAACAGMLVAYATARALAAPGATADGVKAAADALLPAAPAAGGAAAAAAGSAVPLVLTQVSTVLQAQLADINGKVAAVGGGAGVVAAGAAGTTGAAAASDVLGSNAGMRRQLHAMFDVVTAETLLQSVQTLVARRAGAGAATAAAAPVDVSALPAADVKAAIAAGEAAAAAAITAAASATAGAAAELSAGDLELLQALAALRHAANTLQAASIDHRSRSLAAGFDWLLGALGGAEATSRAVAAAVTGVVSGAATRASEALASASASSSSSAAAAGASVGAIPPALLSFIDMWSQQQTSAALGGIGSSSTSAAAAPSAGAADTGSVADAAAAKTVEQALGLLVTVQEALAAASTSE